MTNMQQDDQQRAQEQERRAEEEDSRNARRNLSTQDQGDEEDGMSAEDKAYRRGLEEGAAGALDYRTHPLKQGDGSIGNTRVYTNLPPASPGEGDNAPNRR